MEERQERPVSRRGISNLPMEPARPKTSQRYTSGVRPPSALSTPAQVARVDTSRLQTQTGRIMQPPRTGTLMSLADRPLTQQGLTGLRTATARGQSRQVLDKRYYEGLIRQKMKDISNQMIKLKAEIQTQTEEASTSEVYEARVKEIALELTNLQGELADYNAAIDQININGDYKAILSEAEEVKTENERQTKRLEELYQENLKYEEKIRYIEQQVENEKNMTQRAIEMMNSEERQKYEEQKSRNDNFLAEIRNKQQELDFLSNEKNQLQQLISTSQIKQEAVQLYEKFRERIQRKESLLAEANSRGTPAQEREQLLQKVKEDNSEIAIMERQITQLNDQTVSVKEALEQTEKDLEEGQSERYQKIKDLRKRSEVMEEFLANFDENKNIELTKINQLEDKIEKLLTQMSKKLVREEDILSSDSGIISMITTSSQDLEDKDLEKAFQTLQENIKKMELLHNNVTSELTSLKEKMLSMTKELETFEDLNKLREESKLKMDELIKQRESLTHKKPNVQRLNELKDKNKKVMQQLDEDETYIQLHNLETKLTLLEQSNQSIRNFIDERKNELDYSEVKNSALQLLRRYNDTLKSQVY